MKTILTMLICIFCVSNVKASNIRMYGKEIYGYEQPKYVENYNAGEHRAVLKIIALADPNNFPLSSIEQGSVFNKIFLDMEKSTGIQISLKYGDQNYQENIDNFERENKIYLEDINARFAVPYEEYPYSKNGYIYPAFFENRVHLMMSKNKRFSLQGKENLKKYKGVYVKTDRFPKYILKDFGALGLVESPNYDDAFEKLMTGKIDYIAANYYSSIIETYKKGVRDYVVYSKEPVWRISLFLRGIPKLMHDKRLNELKKYLKSARYKQLKDEAFAELIEIYKNSTQGVLPPKYIGYDMNSDIEDDEMSSGK